MGIRYRQKDPLAVLARGRRGLRGDMGLISFFNGVKNSPRCSRRKDSRIEAGSSFRGGCFMRLLPLTISLTSFR